MEGRHCFACGEPIEEGMRFCPNCGSPVNRDRTTVALLVGRSFPRRFGGETEGKYQAVKKAVMARKTIDAERLEKDFSLPFGFAIKFLTRLQMEGIVGKDTLPLRKGETQRPGGHGGYPVLVHAGEEDEPALPVGAVRVPKAFDGELEERYQEVKKAIAAYEATSVPHLVREFRLFFYDGVRFLMRLQREGVVGKETLPPPPEEAGQPCRHGGYPVLTHVQAEGK